MAQWRTDLNEFKQPHNVHLYELGMIATVDGNPVTNINRFPVSTTLPGSVSAFGEPYAIPITPQIQLDSIYGITSDVFQTYTSGTGAFSGANNALFEVRSGTSVGGYGVLRSQRFLRYRPGQGSLCRMTAMFSTPAANSIQRAGLFNQENALQFGYNGTRFGVLRASGGKAAITVLTINTAPTGSQTVTITLDGVVFTVAVTAGTTTHCATEISDRVNGYTGWLVEQVDNTVVFLANGLGAKSGTFSMSSSGTGTLAAGTFSAKQTGVAQTENWYYQDEWNVDVLDGSLDPITNPSGMLLDPTKLNIYQIQFRWLGAGMLTFSVEDQITGQLVPVHIVHYVNQHTVPHLDNPSFKIGYVAASAGSTTDLVVRGASMMGAIEGDVRQNELNRSFSASKSSLNTTGTVYHLMTIRNPLVTIGGVAQENGIYAINTKELILKDIAVAQQGNDPATIYIFYNPTTFSATHSYSTQQRNNALHSTVDGSFNIATDAAIAQFILPVNGEAQYRLVDFRIPIPPGSEVSIAISSTASIAKVTGALVWSED